MPESSSDPLRPYDPLDYENLARHIVQTLMENEPAPLPPDERFPGSGVYAVYYSGALDWYAPIRGVDIPIYVGKAVPGGRRKGDPAAQPAAPALHQRLTEHRRSIDQAQNLMAADFSCRYLLLVPVWITLAERFLIETFQPIWNTVVDGFGNHPQGRYRSTGRRSRWDVLHPGRPWADSRHAQETVEEIAAQVALALSA
jgi:hypothetical protein